MPGAFRSSPYERNQQGATANNGGDLRGSIAGLTSLASLANASTASSTCNGLPLNMLVHAAMGKVKNSGGYGGSTCSASPAVAAPAIHYDSSLIQNLKNNGINSNQSSLKRGFLEECRKQGYPNTGGLLPSNKKMRLTSNPFQDSASASSSLSKAEDNAALMKRLSSLSGGFPMPKWGGGDFLKSKEESTESIAAQAVQVSHELESMHMKNSFPMPRAKEEDALPLLNEKPSLAAFQEVWQSNRCGDLELQKEALVKMMHRGGK